MEQLVLITQGGLSTSDFIDFAVKPVYASMIKQNLCFLNKTKNYLTLSLFGFQKLADNLVYTFIADAL